MKKLSEIEDRETLIVVGTCEVGKEARVIRLYDLEDRDRGLDAYIAVPHVYEFSLQRELERIEESEEAHEGWALETHAWMEEWFTAKEIKDTEYMVNAVLREAPLWYSRGEKVDLKA
jgi:hypothetical protein